MIEHTCYCGKIYECPFCGTPNGFICPTVNGDEDPNMCDSCLETMFKEMNDYYEQHYEKPWQEVEGMSTKRTECDAIAPEAFHSGRDLGDENPE